VSLPSDATPLTVRPPFAPEAAGLFGPAMLPTQAERMPTPPLQQQQHAVRVVNLRAKPRCWDHGCNGKFFSTHSNMLRHQREKSGAARKPTCPRCGAEFTRTTARNGHMMHEKCKKSAARDA
jgi:hypothetical protein